MKNLILLISIFISICTFAQEGSRTFINECHLSLNQTRYQSDNYSNQIGIGIKIYDTIKHKKNRTVSIGFEYSLLRYGKDKFISYSGRTIDRDIENTNHYLNLSINYRYYLGINKRFIFEFAPYFGYLIDSNRIGTRTSIPPFGPSTTERQKIDRVHTHTLGLQVGMGIKIPKGKYDLIILPSYRLSISENHINFAIGINRKLIQ